jgi:hypothetical protein
MRDPEAVHSPWQARIVSHHAITCGRVSGPLGSFQERRRANDAHQVTGALSVIPLAASRIGFMMIFSMTASFPGM